MLFVDSGPRISCDSTPILPQKSPLLSKEKTLQDLYDFIGQYFEPKIHRSKSATDQEQESSPEEPNGADGDGDLEEGGGVSGEDEIEEAPTPCLQDAYSSKVGDHEEELCWSLGGEKRKTPSPREDFEAFSTPKEPVFSLPPAGSCLSAGDLQTVHQRIQELE